MREKRVDEQGLNRRRRGTAREREWKEEANTTETQRNEERTTNREYDW